jgi:hypothetical protein
MKRSFKEVTTFFLLSCDKSKLLTEMFKDNFNRKGLIEMCWSLICIFSLKAFDYTLREKRSLYRPIITKVLSYVILWLICIWHFPFFLALSFFSFLRVKVFLKRFSSRDIVHAIFSLVMVFFPMCHWFFVSCSSIDSCRFENKDRFSIDQLDQSSSNIILGIFCFLPFVKLPLLKERERLNRLYILSRTFYHLLSRQWFIPW